MRKASVRRYRFWRHAADFGFKTLRTVVWLPATIFGVGLIGYVAFILKRPLLGALAAVVVLAVALGEGAYQMAHLLFEELDKIRRAELAKAEARAAHRSWSDQVQTFLDARSALRPPDPMSGRPMHELVQARMRPPAEPEEDRNSREAHDRETVAQYILEYRDEGLALFERGVQDGHIVPTLRRKFERPDSVYDIHDNVDTVRVLEQRIH